MRDNFESLLAVSTANIRELDGILVGQRGAPCRVAEHDNKYGTLFDCASMQDTCVEEELKNHGFSKEFCKIMKDAYNLGCAWVYFDKDAEELPKEYPTFNW